MKRPKRAEARNHLFVSERGYYSKAIEGEPVGAILTQLCDLVERTLLAFRDRFFPE
jgi:hypothetical protein